MKIKQEYSDEKKRVYAIKKIWRENNKEKVRRWRENIRFGGNVQKVLERDNFQCQGCGMTQEQHILIFGTRLIIHHKDGNGWDKKNKNNEIDNLVCLCHNCHSLLHTKLSSKKKWLDSIKQKCLEYKYPNIRYLVGEQLKKGFSVGESMEKVAKNIGLGYSSIMQRCYKRKKTKSTQDCSGQANVAKKEDTNKSVLPVDSKSKRGWGCPYGY